MRFKIRPDLRSQVEATIAEMNVIKQYVARV